MDLLLIVIMAGLRVSGASATHSNSLIGGRNTSRLLRHDVLPPRIIIHNKECPGVSHQLWCTNTVLAIDQGLAKSGCSPFVPFALESYRHMKLSL